MQSGLLIPHQPWAELSQERRTAVLHLHLLQRCYNRVTLRTDLQGEGVESQEWVPIISQSGYCLASTFNTNPSLDGSLVSIKVPCTKKLSKGFFFFLPSQARVSALSRPNFKASILKMVSFLQMILLLCAFIRNFYFRSITCWFFGRVTAVG